jgi:hypothetical protein
MKALAEGDLEALEATFEAEGYVREPSGSKYKHVGKEGRAGFYVPALGDGGVRLKHCSATFDGKSFAVEYICDKWGQTEFAPQTGMAVYELGSSGLLFAVRIYDDVTPPYEG